MGKASSTKKVARAASTGGSRSHRRVPWTYYSVIALIAILGVLLTWSSRDRRLHAINAAGATAPAVGTVWHEGYAVYVCGQFLPPISSNKSPEGIHTQTPGNGIITIAPTVKSAAGKNAKLGKFASAVGMTLNSAELQVAGGKQYLNGDSCEGKDGHVYVKQFSSVGDKIGQLFNGAKNEQPKLDPSQIPLVDQDLLTIAFVPASDAANIPAPPAAVGTALNKLIASTSTTTTAPTTAPAPTTTAPRSTTSTTVKK